MPGFRSGFKESFSEPASLENTTIADLQGQDLRIKRSWANEGSFSPVGSAEGKRPEFVSAKRVQTPLQGVCTTIERTDESRRAHQEEALKSASFLLYLKALSDLVSIGNLTRSYRFRTQ